MCCANGRSQAGDSWDWSEAPPALHPPIRKAHTPHLLQGPTQFTSPQQGSDQYRPWLFQVRISPAKSLAVPKVNTGLTLDINLDVQVQEKMPGFVDDFVLGLPEQVGVKLKNVVVLHACCRWQIRMMVPDRLEQAARCQHALA